MFLDTLKYLASEQMHILQQQGKIKERNANSSFRAEFLQLSFYPVIRFCSQLQALWSKNYFEMCFCVCLVWFLSQLMHVGITTKHIENKKKCIAS